MMCFSKRQGLIDSICYTTEPLAGLQASEETIAIYFMLHSLGCCIKGQTVIQGMFTSRTKIDTKFKKKHVQKYPNIM